MPGAGLGKRKSFAKIPAIMELPNLIEVQRTSYREFLQEAIPSHKRKRQGLQAVFQGIFPITSHDGRYSLEFISYSLGKPEYSVEDCQRRGMTYAVPLKVKLRLILRQSSEEGRPVAVKDIREQEVYLGELPLMTEGGSFIINGAERVIVSQLHRSPGVCFEEKAHPSGKRLYSARVIPYRGAWVEFEFDAYDLLSVVIDRRRKMPATTFLRALGYSSDEEMIKLFYATEKIKLEGVAHEQVVGRILARDVKDKNGDQVIGESGQEITSHLYREFREAGVVNISVVISSDDALSIINTLRKDYRHSEEEALLDIFHRLRPGDPASVENARQLLHRLFFDPRRYDLGRVGRYKLNRKLGVDVPLEETTLRKEDIVEIIRYLIKLKNREGSLDDIDHLGNRRVRTVGELVENQFRIGLARAERALRERIGGQDIEELMPHNLINPKVIFSAVKDFFARSQLSQFMDQVNPLAELTHKRRLSALGPGGLSRERAGFEVRDVHFSHYGRICPVETPEGPNIGLIVSLSTYARVNKLGFLETPYRRVKEGKATKDIHYLSADVEDEYVIAQANAKLDAQGRFQSEEVFARARNDARKASPREIDYMDISPKQLVSVAAALIPFLEHDDANRALMGCNMQRQAVPLLQVDSPLIGTGLEEAAAKDSGVVVIASRGGKVESVSADRISIRTQGEVFHYNLKKFLRSNQDTCLNQRPIVQIGDEVSAGQVIADGPATYQGELALGRNMLVAFMPWRGYNFEDAILISEKVVKEDIYTSVHIEEFELEARDTKLGPEEITRDIPNVREEALRDLDENGIIRIGAEVKPGDILTGKVTPKSEVELSPEEKLLRAIFGEKAGDVRDASLRVPPGVEGIVVDVKVFSRREGRGKGKGSREKEVKRAELPSGVFKLVKVYIASKRKLSVGDKMAGRHGNKGVIARILPEEDMPFLPDGTAVEIVLNPLGVPSRMNLGQILETHLGWAAHALGMRIASPVFNGATEGEIKDTLEAAGLPRKGTTVLFDGRSGEPFKGEIAVGYIYMMKLAHLVDDKIHARSIGPYSLVTQQPLGGKAQFGGQRFGEMEVWALEAYGAAYTLQELLTVKSDDVVGRTRIYEAIVKGENTLRPGTPESFNVLIKELQGLGLDVKVEKRKAGPEARDRGDRETGGTGSFNSVSISIASPEAIKSWSRGEVKKPETINYRTFKPEKDGLFCERIFGPTKDWECNCGKYRRIKYKGVICDRCGVEVTQSKVRRERMGHIKLASPVSHIWFFKTLPSRMGALLGMGLRSLEKVLYYEEYVVIDPGETGLTRMDLITDEEYRKYREQFGDKFKAKMGAEAIRQLVKELDLDQLSSDLRKELKETSSQQTKLRIAKRLKVVESFRQSGNKSEWMIMDVIPVIPPDLRPLVPLDGGRFATSDLNDLYRRVLNRNNRLKKLLQDPVTPKVIIRNEKRMLQEAVDALMDNGRHGRPVMGAGNRPLKSLSDTLKGKQGRFRQNLLGKRVDYSGRSVIVIDPKLKLHQCGLPKKMALELFEPFIIKKLKEREFVHTIKSAKRMVERVRPEVWDILEEVIKDHPVLLNRAPTLHRLGIQAFQPILVEGKAIHIHPLVCTAFNADFDGDQMAVHIPLSTEAQMESRLLLLSLNNILSPSDGRPITVPTQDIVLGCHYLTSERPGNKEEGRTFSDPGEVVLAQEAGEVGLQTRIRLRLNGRLIETTTGRVLFNEALGVPLPFVNEEMNKKALTELIDRCYRKHGAGKTAEVLDNLKEIGFEIATLMGISICIDDIRIPPEKETILKQARREVDKIEEQYRKGAITDGERYNKVIDTWTHANDRIEDIMFKGLKRVEGNSSFNSIYMMAQSGARGSRLQIRQLAGMRGLMAKPSGEIIESPVTSNFREGLTVLEYFLSTHGGRKGLADTALKTANSGYLTRRLVDVAQDVIVNEEDCGTLNGITVTGVYEGGEEIIPLKDRILGRVALDDVLIPRLGEPIVRAGEEIPEETAEIIREAGIEEVRIRSVLTCESKRGVCQKCYGRNLANGKMVALGEAVGVIAAQSIGEPGTQLTMRTFHIGGTASRLVEQSEIAARDDGIIHCHNLRTVKNREGNTVVLNRNGAVSICNDEDRELERYAIPSGAIIKLNHLEKVRRGEVFVAWDPYTRPILTEVGGKVKFEDIVEGVTMREEVDPATNLTMRVIIEHKEDLHPQIVIRNDKEEILGYYSIPSWAHIVVRDGDTVSPGDLLAKTPREITGTTDITGGLPRVVELFEARRPKDPAIITEIDGVVEFAGSVRGKRRIVVKNDETGMSKEYLISPGKHLNVYKGDRVRAGQQLIEGPVVPQDILKVRGMTKLQEYLLNEVQEVYRLQGVIINDKHIEVIIRKMLGKMEVEDAGDTDFLIGEHVDRFRYEEENERVLAKKGKPAKVSPVLLGITRASLNTDSFISAASFQETTRILTEAAFSGKRDELRGLKENVIMGHLVPAGTGMDRYREIGIVKNADIESVSKEGKEKD